MSLFVAAALAFKCLTSVFLSHHKGSQRGINGAIPLCCFREHVSSAWGAGAGVGVGCLLLIIVLRCQTMWPTQKRKMRGSNWSDSGCQMFGSSSWFIWNTIKKIFVFSQRRGPAATAANLDEARCKSYGKGEHIWRASWSRGRGPAGKHAIVPTDWSSVLSSWF